MPKLNPVTTWCVATMIAVAVPAGADVVDINGIQIYYEVHGEGEPLLLLHGGLGSSDYWPDQLGPFSERYRVIAMDSRGHGRSTFDDTPISYDLMTSDVIGLLDHLGVEKTDVLGWSDGGVIGLNMAIHHPGRVGKVIAYGANYSPAGVREDIMENERFLAYVGRATADYQKLSPAPGRWEEFMGNLGNMWATEPTFTAEELGSITAPVLVFAGVEEEGIREEHTRELASLIPSADLVLMEGTGHFAHLDKPEEFNQVILDFLATPMSQPDA